MSTKAIRTAILNRLRAIDGSGAYHVTLTGDRQVLSGRYKRPPGVTPFVCVWTHQVDESITSSAQSREQTGTFNVLGWVAGSPKDPASRQDNAEDLADDLRAALRADPRLGGLAITMTVSAVAWDDEQVDSPDKSSFGIALLSVVVTWREP